MDLTRDAVIEVERIVRQGQTPQVSLVTLTGPEGKPVVVATTRDAQGVIHLTSVKRLADEYRTAPERRAGVAKLGTIESFIGHVNRHKDTGSVLFGNADPKAPTLTAIFDYNLAGPALAPPPNVKASAEEIATPPPATLARFGVHRAAYAFPLSEEWKAWTALDGKKLSQADFAVFLEDRIADVIEPNPELMGPVAKDFAQRVGLGVGFASVTRLLSIASDMKLHVNSKVRESRSLQSGETQIQYEEEHVDQQGQPIKVPGAFFISVPVFKSGGLYTIPARLRYRVAGGQISWWFDLYRTDLFLDSACSGAFQTAEAATGLPLFEGTPET